MPANHPPEARRGKMLQGIFWAGIALAPVAVLILLFGQSTGTLRVAVTLAVLTIVLLAVSIAMRPSVEMLRVDIEHRVLDEVERVRVRAREETTTAARNTHRALTDKIHGLAESVEDLRHQLDEVQAAGVLTQHSPPALGAPPGGPGVVRRTETVHVTRRTTTVDAADETSGGGTVYGSRAASGPPMEAEWREEPRPDDRRWDQRWGDMSSGDRWAAVRADEHGRELQVGERRASVHSDDRGSELRVEDRWAALRRDEPRRDPLDGDPNWDATFRSMSRPAEPRALPPSRGESPSRYIDERDDRSWSERGRDDDRSWSERGRDDDRSREPVRSRGHEREPERDRERPRDDWERHFDRGREPARDQDRDRDRERDRDRDRDRDERDRGGHDRDREYGRPREPERDRDRDYDRDRDRDRDYDRGREHDHDRDRDHDRYERDRPYPPRQRGPHPSEYDR